MIHPDLTATTVRLLVGKDDANIVEIGANDGSDTLAFLHCFPQGRVTCFECDPRAIKTWRDRVSDKRATLHEVALADVPGEMPFYPSGGRPPGWNIESWDKSGSLLPPDRHVDYAKWLSFGKPFQVPVTTLDIVRGDDDSVIDFCWCDVQGAEAKVLKGAEKSYLRMRWIYLECHSRPYYHGQATIGELAALLPGFVLHAACANDNFLFRNTRFEGDT